MNSDSSFNIFLAKSLPPISISGYFQRIVQYADPGVEALIVADVLINRLRAVVSFFCGLTSHRCTRILNSRHSMCIGLSEQRCCLGRNYLATPFTKMYFPFYRIPSWSTFSLAPVLPSQAHFARVAGLSVTELAALEMVASSGKSNLLRHFSTRSTFRFELQTLKCFVLTTNLQEGGLLRFACLILSTMFIHFVNP